MTIELKLQQVTKELTGLYSVYANVVETETGKILSKKCAQGSTLTQIKDALRPFWTEAKADYNNYQTMRAIAEAALDELEAE